MRVLISGAGIAGLTAAYWFERSGHTAIVVEKAPSPRGEGYMIDFFSSGYDIAQQMGILPELERVHYPISRLSFLKPNGEERFSIDYAALRKLFDDRHFNFMRGDLERVLFEEIRGRAELRFGTTISGIRQSKDGVEATLDDGTVERVDLAIAADGVHSQLRALAFGDGKKFERFLGYASMAFIVDPIARLEPDAFYTLTEPHRQVSVYPIRGGKLATLFLHRTDDQVSTMTLDQARSRMYDVYSSMGSKPSPRGATRTKPDRMPWSRNADSAVELKPFPSLSVLPPFARNFRRGVVQLIGQRLQHFPRGIDLRARQRRQRTAHGFFHGARASRVQVAALFAQS